MQERRNRRRLALFAITSVVGSVLITTVTASPAHAAGATSKVASMNSGETGTANAASSFDDMTPDGQYVCFSSPASNVVAGDGNGQGDVFLRNRLTNATIRISVDAGGGDALGASTNCSISDDGTVVAFQSTANDIVAGDTNGFTDVFVKDINSFANSGDDGATQRVSIGIDGSTQGTGESNNAIVSADGSRVAFTSVAANLATTDTNGDVDAFVTDVGGATELVSATTGSATTTGDGNAQAEAISDDGTYVVFTSFSTNISVPANSGVTNVFRRNIDTNATDLVSVNGAGTDGSSSISYDPVIDADASVIAFTSLSDELAPIAGGNFDANVYARDMTAGTTELVDVNFAGNAAGSGASAGAEVSDITPDGRYVVFDSASADLTATNDSGFNQDVYRRDLQANSTVRISQSSYGEGGEGPSFSKLDLGLSVISDDGRFVSFATRAPSMTALDFEISVVDPEDEDDIVVRDVVAGDTVLVSTDLNGVDGGNGQSTENAISSNGRVVAFQSYASNIAETDTNNNTDVFVTADMYRWDHGGGNNFWNTAANWVGDQVPPASADVIFPKGQAGPINYNVGGSLSYGSVLLNDDGYSIGGTEEFGIQTTLAVTGFNASGTVSSPLYIDGDAGFNTSNYLSVTGAVDLGSNTLHFPQIGEVAVSGVISGSGGIEAGGNFGVTTLSGANTFTGGIANNGATVHVNGNSSSSATTVTNYGAIGGSGTLGALTVSGSSGIDPGDSGPGDLTTGNFSFTSGNYIVDIAGTAPGTGHDQLTVNGTVTLGGSLSLEPEFIPASGTSFTIIENDGSDAVSGTFNGLAQGATIDTYSGRFTVSYTGGTGNDVVLTSSTPTWDGGAADDNMTSPANWVGDVAPVADDPLSFPAGASSLTPNNNFAAGTDFSAIGFADDYTISGNAFDVPDTITVTAGNVTITPVVGILEYVAVTTPSGATLTFVGGVAIDDQLFFHGHGDVNLGPMVALDNDASVDKYGFGTLTLNGTSTFDGSVEIHEGYGALNGTFPGSITPREAQFEGTGTIDWYDTHDTFNESSMISPGTFGDPGAMTINDFMLHDGDFYVADIAGTTAGTQYDQITTADPSLLNTGAPEFEPGELWVDLDPAFVPVAGSTFTIINNTSSNPVEGEFADFNEGDIITLGASRFEISYVGGTGNDVVLTTQTPVQFSVADVTANEPDSGTTNVTFTVTLSEPAIDDMSVTVNTADVTAGAGADYDAVEDEILSFVQGDTSKTVTFPIHGDTIDEDSETFNVVLSDPVGGTILDGTAVGTITDNAADTGTGDLNQVVVDGETVSTGADATSGDPVQVAITAPANGTVSVDEQTSTTFTVDGYDIVPYEVAIAAPTGTTGDPIRMAFRLHSSVLTSADRTLAEAVTELDVFRNGTVVGECPGATTAIPDPCVAERSVSGDDGVITVLSSAASDWNFGFAAAADDPDSTFDADNGYWLVAEDGGIFTYGDADFYGSAGSINLNQPIVGMASTPTRQGYWLVASDGGIFSYGDAKFYGSTGSMKLNQPIIGMAATPTGGGYWLVAEDGGIFAFGDAKFYGSTGGMKINQPIIGMSPTPNGDGYWLVALDGGIFSFGEADFFGSAGAIDLNQPILGMAATPDGDGYWLVAADGGIFSYGAAEFHGSAGDEDLVAPIMGMRATSTGNGYWLVAADGGIFTYGDAPFAGSAGSIDLNAAIVGMG